MKAHRLNLTMAALHAVAFSFALPAAGNANERAARDHPATPNAWSTATADPQSEHAVRVAADDTEDRNLRHFTGRSVRGIGGQDLGTIKDFLLKVDSGRLEYMVVSSGGILGVAETLRLAPAESLTWDGGSGSFNVNLARSQWDQVPAIHEQNYKSGSIVVTAGHRRLMEHQFGATAHVDPSGTATADLIRASEIRGKTVRAGEHNLGEIEEIVIDLRNRMATALIELESDFADTSDRFLVPLSRLTFGYIADEPATTRLRAADFARAQAAAHASPTSLPASDITGAPGISQSSVTGQTGYSSAQSAEAANTETTDAGIIDERELAVTPTGRSAVQQYPAADSGLYLAAQSVRQTLDNNASLANADIQVQPESGHLVLRGSVHSDALRAKVEAAARRTAPEIEIDNQITVRK